MTERGLSFGAVASRYERFRPGYPDELFDMVAAYARRPIATALEIGAGTGKATRLFAGRGVTVTATDPDEDMLTVLQQRVPASVRTIHAAFEDLRLGPRYDLIYAAAALHWTRAEGRWPRIAALLHPGGVFASCGGPIRLADPAVAAAIEPFVVNAEIPSPDGTPAGPHLQWPGTELQRSELFTDVREFVVERRLSMSAADYVGHLSTVSAYLTLPAERRKQAFAQILAALPDRVEVNADLIVHLGRKGVPPRHRCSPPTWGGGASRSGGR